MPMIGAVIVPHPPLIIPTVGRGQERQVQTTIDAYRAAATQVADWKPEVLVISSPHAIMYADYFHISPGAGASGSMASFGAPQTCLEVKYDAELRRALVQQAEAAGLQAGTLGERDPSLDHGTFLPLYFLQEAGVDCPTLRIGLSGFSPLQHYQLGQCAAKAVDKLGRRAAGRAGTRNSPGNLITEIRVLRLFVTSLSRLKELLGEYQTKFRSKGFISLYERLRLPYSCTRHIPYRRTLTAVSPLLPPVCRPRSTVLAQPESAHAVYPGRALPSAVLSPALRFPQR